MDKRGKESKLEQDLKTIVECEIDSANQEGNDCDIDGIEFEENFKHLELRSNLEPQVRLFDNKYDYNESSRQLEERKVPLNLFGSRTYTSPASLESSSGDSAPFKNECIRDYKEVLNKQHLIKSRTTSLQYNNERQNSDKFSMLRNVVENIEDPEKRRILLNFIDQSTVKTEYITIKETSSSGEEVKGLHKICNFQKRRRKSPASVMPKSRLYKTRKNFNTYSQDRKRFSCAGPSLKTIGAAEQNLENFVIERKTGSEEGDSKNNDHCYTEESREVPLEAILNRINQYQKPLPMSSRRQSGYSASRDEGTHPGDHNMAFDNPTFDYEVTLDLEEGCKRKGKDIIILSGDILETEKRNTDEMANKKHVKKWTNRLKTFALAFLIVALIATLTRGIFVEIERSSYKAEIKELENEVSEYYNASEDWKSKYDQCVVGGTGISNEELDNSPQTTAYHRASP